MRFGNVICLLESCGRVLWDGAATMNFPGSVAALAETWL